MIRQSPIIKGAQATSKSPQGKAFALAQPIPIIALLLPAQFSHHPMAKPFMTASTTTLPPETIKVTKRRIACDGGGALGHPRVYLEMGQGAAVECPYCDRRFELDASRAEHDGH
jgi:uncharacterized Zn-finger protein